MNNLLPGELLYDAFPKPQTADLGERLKNEHFLAAMVENCMVNHATSGFFDTWKLKRLFVQLASTQSRGRQHVLGFHLLYMLSLINFYGKFGNRKN